MSPAYTRSGYNWSSMRETARRARARARRAGAGEHLDAAVVGQGRQPGGLGDCVRLGRGVLRVAGPRLVEAAGESEVVERAQAKQPSPQQAPHLGDLGRVPGGQSELR